MKLFPRKTECNSSKITERKFLMYEQRRVKTAFAPTINNLNMGHNKELLQPSTIITARTLRIMGSVFFQFAEGVILNLESMWEESDSRTPMVCFLSMGSDPTASIEALAKKLRTDCRNISMGQGQEVHARRLLTQFMNEGGWVLLQNCHLGLGFMDELLETVKADYFH